MPANREVTDEQLEQTRADREACDHDAVSWRWAAVEFIDGGEAVVVPGRCPDCDAAMRRWYDHAETTTQTVGGR